jgi:hypothetical protein
VGNGRIGLNQDFTATRRAARFNHPPAGTAVLDWRKRLICSCCRRADMLVSETKPPRANS